MSGILSGMMGGLLIGMPSGINDGAAAVVVMSKKEAEKRGM